jgi:hypothetical protein
MKKALECGLRHRWIPFPDREEIKRHSDDEQRYRETAAKTNRRSRAHYLYSITMCR